MQYYRVIGGDQKEYGPVSEEELRRWIAEGRLSAQSRISTDPATGWRPLSEFPEFAEALRTQVGGAVPPPGEPMPPVSAEIWREHVLSSQPQVRIGDCLKRSFDLVVRHFGLLFGAAFLVWLLSILSTFVPFGGWLIFWVLRGVLYGGVYVVFLNTIRGKPSSVGEVFSGFNVAFAQLLLVGIITSFLSFIGAFCCLVIPGLYLFVAWKFSVPLVADRRLDFWPAMEMSRKVVNRVWFEVLALILVAFLPAILTYLFVQGKISLNMMPMVREIFEAQRPDLSRLFALSIQTAKANFLLLSFSKLVLLLNMPFALGAFSYAYEDIFGTRTQRTG